MFSEIDPKATNASLEKEILSLWKKNNTFQKLLELRKDEPSYIFYEGPPTANGKPGIHHVMARSIKDTICRYKSMKGFLTKRKAGWDTHGLPVEIEVQKKLGIEGKLEIEEYGIEKFNTACRDSVFTYKELWDKMTTQMGYWIDLKDPYITLDNNYIESVWWILKQFHDADLIYRGHRVVPYCPKCETPLSTHEVAQGYKDIKDLSAYVLISAIDQDFDFLVWTTTPWTLFSNVAIALGKDIEYVKIKVANRERPFILAKSRLSIIDGEYTLLETINGSTLLDINYKPLFPHAKPDGKAHITIEGDFVTTEDGSGLVHIAPAFGEDDYRVSKENGLSMLNTVNSSGCFDNQVPEFEGRFVKDTDVDIVVMLKQSNQLFKSQKIEHSYPHCWRCQSPLLYYARDAWYIEVTKIKEDLIRINKEVNWVPNHIGTGRFGSWLENLQDWSLSRDRYWGTPLNIWLCTKEECGHELCIGSIEELKKHADVGDNIELHKPWIDEVILHCEKCNSKMERTPEVIDCWFDSGAMPFAQHHYPFENKDNFDELFPADFISEGIDQTRGWFYSLIAISGFLKKQSPYRNVLVGELVLDKDGQKMSKSKGNSIDPFKMLDKYGADTVRWYLLTSTSVWLPTKFDEEGLKATKRKYFDTLVNTYRFFVLYANIDKFGPDSERIPLENRPYMDRWLLARMNSIVVEVTSYMDKYDITKAMNSLSTFLAEDVSNWYVRLNRRRFWKEGDDNDKFSAYCTLQEIMIAISHLMAPVAPFLSDLLYRELTGEESVHLSRMPDGDPQLEDLELENKMSMTRRVVELGRNLRTKHSLKVRQPLAEIMVQSKDEVFTDLILAELNVKNYKVIDANEEIVKKKLKVNYRKLGPIFGKNVPKAAAELNKLSNEHIKDIEAGQSIKVRIEDIEHEVPSDCVDILCDQLEGLVAEGDGLLTVALSTELSDELINEGYAREFVNRAQNSRKENGLDITDRINISIFCSNEFQDALFPHSEKINYELLSSLSFENSEGSEELEKHTIDKHNFKFKIIKT
jgi:isoleucyl-tRNA synthetase